MTKAFFCTWRFVQNTPIETPSYKALLCTRRFVTFGGSFVAKNAKGFVTKFVSQSGNTFFNFLFAPSGHCKCNTRESKKSFFSWRRHAHVQIFLQIFLQIFTPKVTNLLTNLHTEGDKSSCKFSYKSFYKSSYKSSICTCTCKCKSVACTSISANFCKKICHLLTKLCFVRENLITSQNPLWG